MDINKLIHAGDFNFKSSALGELRCGPIGDELSKFYKMAKNNVDGETLARSLVASVAHKLTGDPTIDEVAGGPSLSIEDAALILRAELDNFCDQFVSRRLRVMDNEQTEREGRKEVKPETTTSGCDGLGTAIITHINSQRAQMERILGSARENIIGNTASDTLRRYMRDNEAVEQLKKFSIGESIAEQMRKFQAGSALEQMKRDALGKSALEAAFRTVKASDNLNETLAALRASNPAAFQEAPVNPPPTNFVPPHNPQNPILETNNILKKQQAYTEEIRPTIIRTVELIQTLTDTTLATQAAANANSEQAERHARRSMGVAIVSVIIAVVTSSISIYYANASPTAEQLDLLSKGFREQLGAMTTSAQVERVAAERKAAEDRAMLASVIAKQSELINSVTKSKDTTTQHNSSK